MTKCWQLVAPLVLKRGESSKASWSTSLTFVRAEPMVSERLSFCRTRIREISSLPSSPERHGPVSGRARERDGRFEHRTSNHMNLGGPTRLGIGRWIGDRFFCQALRPIGMRRLTIGLSIDTASSLMRTMLFSLQTCSKTRSRAPFFDHRFIRV